MQVEAVLVDEILVAPQPDEPHADVVATLYEFGEPQWVSTHGEREGNPVGPLMRVGDGEAGALADMRVKSFGKRPLHVEAGRRVISFHDRWTAPPWSVYALVLPPLYVARVIDLQPPSAGYYNHREPKLAVSPDGRIFYHALFSEPERTSFDIRARLELDEDEFTRQIRSAEVVAGTDSYKHLREAVRDGAKSPDLWFKLLELGGKLLGGP